MRLRVFGQRKAARLCVVHPYGDPQGDHSLEPPGANKVVPAPAAPIHDHLPRFAVPAPGLSFWPRP